MMQPDKRFSTNKYSAKTWSQVPNTHVGVYVGLALDKRYCDLTFLSLDIIKMLKCPIVLFGPSQLLRWHQPMP